jgi:hypothetical protein
MCASQYITQFIGVVVGVFIGIFAEPIRAYIYRPVLTVSFDERDPACKTFTPQGTVRGPTAIYVRAKVQNSKSKMAKACRAYLVNVEQKDPQGLFEQTIYADSLSLDWSCQREGEGGRPIDLPSEVSQYIDVISTEERLPRNYNVRATPMPLRYGELFDMAPKVLRFTILVTGDDVKPAKISLIFSWQGQWDTFEVANG